MELKQGWINTGLVGIASAGYPPTFLCSPLQLPPWAITQNVNHCCLGAIPLCVGIYSVGAGAESTGTPRTNPRSLGHRGTGKTVSDSIKSPQPIETTKPEPKQPQQNNAHGLEQQNALENDFRSMVRKGKDGVNEFFAAAREDSFVEGVARVSNLVFGMVGGISSDTDERRKELFYGSDQTTENQTIEQLKEIIEMSGGLRGKKPLPLAPPSAWRTLLLLIEGVKY